MGTTLRPKYIYMATWTLRVILNQKHQHANEQGRALALIVQRVPSPDFRTFLRSKVLGSLGMCENFKTEITEALRQNPVLITPRAPTLFKDPITHRFRV